MKAMLQLMEITQVRLSFCDGAFAHLRVSAARKMIHLGPSKVTKQVKPNSENLRRLMRRPSSVELTTTMPVVQSENGSAGFR